MIESPHRHSKNDTKSSILNGGYVALGIAIGVVASLIMYLTLNWSEGSITLKEVFNVAPEIVALVVAGASTFLTTIALKEQRKIREAGTDPVVLVHFGQRADARELVTLKLSNVGAGAAMDVQLSVDTPDVDLQAYHLVTNIFERHHPFRTILQGESVEFSFAMGFDLLGERILPPFKARIEYSDIEGSSYTAEFVLDIREMEKLGAEQSLEARRTKATEAVSKALTQTEATTKRLLVEVSDLAERVRRYEKTTEAPTE